MDCIHTRRSQKSVIFTLLFFAALLGINAAEIKLGDTRERVLAVLGQPQGRLQDRTEETLTYPRGNVILQQGVVTQVHLLSEEELQKQLAARRSTVTTQPNAALDSRAEPVPSNAVPISINNNLVIVPVRLNDLPTHLILDTGAARLALTPEIAAEAGIGGPRHAKLKDATSAQEHARLATAGSVSVGSTVMNDVPVIIGNIAPTVLKRGDGLLGFSFLKNFIFCIDYQRKLLSFPDKAGLPKNGSAVPIQYAQKGSMVIANLEVDGTPAKFLVDTGLSYSLCLESWFVEQEKLRERYRIHRKSDIHSVVGVEQQSFTCLKSLKLGNHTLINVPAAFRSLSSLPPGIAGAIGGGVLHIFTATFDIQGHELWLEPNDSYFWQTLAWKTGMAIGDNWTVLGITPDSSAAMAEVRVGDRILEINGHPISSLTRQELEATFNHEAGTRVRLRLKAKEETPRNVSLVLP